MQWLDRIKRVKIALVIAALLIAMASLAVSHFLVKDMEKEEYARMEIWAEAMRSLNRADETTPRTCAKGNKRKQYDSSDSAELGRQTGNVKKRGSFEKRIERFYKHFAPLCREMESHGEFCQNKCSKRRLSYK